METSTLYDKECSKKSIIAQPEVQPIDFQRIIRTGRHRYKNKLGARAGLRLHLANNSIPIMGVAA